MTYRPSIYIRVSEEFEQSAGALADALMLKWPHGMPPIFTNEIEASEGAVVIANGYASLLKILPLLIDLKSKTIPTVLCCDDFGDLSEYIDELGTIKLSFDADASLITGVLFGMVQRNQQVAKLRGQVGLVKTLHTGLQENLTNLQFELETAATVQKEFMSSNVQDVHGISFSSLWRPASVVSGDMYDITQLDDDHVALFLVDAIGHGISAAMLAMMLTRTLAANRFDSTTGSFTQPRDILKHLNAALLDRTGESARFATAAYGILNCNTNQFTYAGAGHPPTLLSRFEQEPVLLESEGPLLGVFEQDDFPQCTVNISKGDTLLMYSDGFEFALSKTSVKQNSDPTHLQMMQTFCDENNGDTLQKISSYLNRANASTAEDDLTMICMHSNLVTSSIRLAA